MTPDLVKILAESGVSALDKWSTASVTSDALKRFAAMLNGASPLEVATARVTAVREMRAHEVRDAFALARAAFSERQAETTSLPSEPSANPEELRQLGSPVLESSAILALVGAYVSAAGYAGDPTAPQVIYLALTSRLLPRPVNLNVTGPSAGGKNFAVRAALELFPPAAYHETGGASPLALIYNPSSFAHRVVIVGESSALHTEGIGASMIRGLAWDQRLAYETVIDGEHVRLEKDGPTGLITTSTRELDDELSTRMWAVPIPDTRQQTRAVLAATARRTAGHMAPSGAVSVATFVAAQEWLAAVGTTSVVVPFAEALAELLPDHEVRLRRDFSQLLALVQAHTLLHQCTRSTDAEGRVVATLADYAVVRTLVADMFTTTIASGLSKEIRETVEAVRVLTGQGSSVSSTDVAKHLGLSPSGAWLRIQKALRRHWLANDETRKHQPAKLRPGEALPATDDGLPDPDVVAERHACRGDV